MGVQVGPVLQRLGLPPTLVTLLREGRLREAVDEAYAEQDRLNALLDDWEAANPLLATQVPWYETRKAWKAAGRPRPEWYEVLARHHSTVKPLLVAHISHDLCGMAQKAWLRRNRRRYYAEWEKRRAQVE